MNFTCGHPLTQLNSYVVTKGKRSGQRKCRTCALEQRRDYVRRKAVGEPLKPNHNRTKTDCPNGHPYNVENTYVNPRSGHRTCKPCQNSYQSGYMPGYQLRTRYRLTHKDRVRMLIEQDGLCAICYEEPATQVDHDHATGTVRGLLCGQCNKALGLLKDSAETARFAAEYLEGVG